MPEFVEVAKTVGMQLAKKRRFSGVDRKVRTPAGKSAGVFYWRSGL
jgi:hypothetical protein